jgi:hypothetical protein
MRKFFTLSFILISINLFSQDYFPLVVGNTWVLNILDSDGQVVGTDSTVIGDNYKLNNMNIFLMKELIHDGYSKDSVNNELYTDSINHNDIYGHMNDIWQKIWQHHYTNGDKWAFTSDSIHVEYIGKVSVPAGNFDSCYYVKTDSTSGWVFAPNVGIIKTISENKTGYTLKNYKVTLANVSGITEVSKENIKVYPNPSSDYISIQNVENSIQLSIYDLTGKLYYITKKISSENELINIIDYPTGIYFGRILLNDQRNVYFKFIKK